MRRDAAALGPPTAAVLWGGMYVVSKWGFGAIPPVTLAFLRVLLGGATLYAVVSIVSPERDFSTSERRRFAGLGVLVALTLVTQFVGTDLTNASQGSLLTVLTPVFTLLLGATVLGESLTARKVGGMALAAVGTLVVAAGSYDLSSLGAGNALGLASLLVAGAAWAAFTVYGAPLVRRYSALEAATYGTLLSVPILGVLAAVELWTLGISPLALPTSLPVLGAVAYLGVASTAAAWYCWYAGVERYEAGTVAGFFFFQPVVGAALGALFLGESLGPLFLVGGGVIAVGVYLSSVARE
ncbi:DMT family transporter [Halospeciosus flavus]|uniref:DMT family transporter n=1 Tax=Halospeciosus flavus TaxID=3032283 RepID=A0ABD5Z451_9EURY|nr:DMT family transporter [Halospeciosus flavus]